MARPVWTGHIAFGLVNVPVVLYSAERRADLNLRLIDSRNDARVRYERVNDETGEEVPWDKVVKGYEYDGGSLVLLSDDELEHASPELTRTIDVAQFVSLSDIDPIYFDKPYFLLPGKGGAKGYVLLRDALNESGKAGLATVVIRTRQYVAAVRPHDTGLVLQLLRYHQELRDLQDFDLPEAELRKVKASKQERTMATQLIDAMTDSWDPKDFHDEYHDAVMKMIKDKIAAGETEAVDVPDDEDDSDDEVTTINFLDVLRKSVEGHAGRSKSSKKSSSKSATKSAPKAQAQKSESKLAAKRPATTKRSTAKKKAAKKKRAS